MNEVKICSLVGLAQKAGKVVSGDAALENNLRRGQGVLLLIANDCGINNRKKYVNLAEREHIEFCFFSNKSSLGIAVGKDKRVAVLITDDGFARAIKKMIV